MSEYKLAKNPALIKEFDGEEYIFSGEMDGKELWLPVSGLEIKKRQCAICGYSGVALDRHHIHGRKNSDVTIDLCANCHREHHMKFGYK